MTFRLTVVTCLLLALGAGCRKSEVKVAPPGVGGPIGTPAVAPPEPTPSVEQVAPEPTTYDFERGIPSDPGALIAPNNNSAPAAPSSALPPDAGPAPRDLSAELSAALAGITSCVDAAKAAAQHDGKLTISVTASVLASGALSRSDVRAPGQPEAALRCLEQQVANLRLGPDVPGAPQRVSGSTTVQVKAAAGNTGAASGQPATSAASGNTPPPARSNPDIARPEPPDLARPDPPDLAGPPN